jgi:hypothetical protein
MTSFGSGNARFYSTLEEAKAAGKPAGKDSWEYYSYSGFEILKDDKGNYRMDSEGNYLAKRVTLVGATGGAAVLGWQISVAIGGWTATKAEGGRKSAELEEAKAENERVKAENDRLRAQLEALKAGQPTEEPAKRGKK